MNIEIAVIKGEGVGPEIMGAVLEVLKSLCKKCGHKLMVHPVRAGAEAIENGEVPLSQESLSICENVPAVLFGNSGLSKYKNLPLEQKPEWALMELRKKLGVTTNIRPVKVYPSLKRFSPLKEDILKNGIDFVFVRDLSGGILCSEKVKSEGDGGKEAYEYEYYNESIVRKTAQWAFRLAQGRKKKVVNLDKSNVLESSRLWRKTVIQTSKEYPDIWLDHDYIDHGAMQILCVPEQFDVLVTSNVFGDIISDEGTQISGTPYLYGSAELDETGHGIYTPNQIHHPDESIIGKQIANPIGMIAAAAMMLRYTFGMEQEALIIEDAIERVIEGGGATKDIWLPGKELISTEEMGKRIAALL